jgi:hypothetical protein
MLMFLQLLHQLHFQPKLSLITRTIAAATSQLGHLLILFFIVELCFALLGHVVFGSSIEQFSSLSVSAQSLIYALFGALMELEEDTGRVVVAAAAAAVVVVVVVAVVVAVVVVVAHPRVVVAAACGGVVWRCAHLFFSLSRRISAATTPECAVQGGGMRVEPRVRRRSQPPPPPTVTTDNDNNNNNNNNTARRILLFPPPTYATTNVQATGTSDSSWKRCTVPRGCSSSIFT